VDLFGVPGTPRSDGDGDWAREPNRLTGTAGPETDLFLDPASEYVKLNALRLTVPAPDGDFQLSARVSVGFDGTYDAGALLVWANETTWAKLCLEFSPQREPMVVSVVTRGRSDDANNVTVDRDAIWLRVSRRDGAYAYHASHDGSRWNLVRHFTLGESTVDLGFAVQAPMGQGCTATFTDITFTPQRLAELRDGT
jgi:uncharacterized protein